MAFTSKVCDTCTQDPCYLDKRAHHNELERKRRDHIKDSFYGLRDCIPSLLGEKVSREGRGGEAMEEGGVNCVLEGAGKD